MLALGLPGDPLGWAMHAVVGALVHFADTGHEAITGLLDTYLFSTVDATTATHGALTSNSSLAFLNHGVMLIADALLAVTFVVAFLRLMFDHTPHSHYGFRLMAPRLALVLVLVHFSLPLIQLLIDLENGLAHAAMQLGIGAPVPPWERALAQGNLLPLLSTQNLFLAVFVCGLIVGLVILAMALVVRYALLGVLIVSAPLAALCMLLPETVGYARTWGRLFSVTLFMQVVQLLILRVATTVALGPSAVLPQTLYSLATLWLMVKVPGAMNTAAHLETKAHTMGHDLEKSVRKALLGPHAARSTR